MPIDFQFDDIVDDRDKGCEVLHYNEPYAVLGSVGTFTTSYLPLDVGSPSVPDVYNRRLHMNLPPIDTGIILTETLTLANVVAGSMLFYCNYSTGLVTVDPDLFGVCTFSATPTNTVNKTAHGFTSGTLVGFSTTGSLPAALTSGVLYYVVNAADDTFQVSLTLGGAPISFASAGSGTSYVGIALYVTYNGPISPYGDVQYLVPSADADLLCRIKLQEVPLEFNLASSDSRKIAIQASTYGPLTETRQLENVVTTPLDFYVEYDVGRVTFNSLLSNDTVFVTYYGSGSAAWAKDIQTCTAAFARVDQLALATDGSNPMTADLDMGSGSNSIQNFGTGTVDTIHVAAHNHEDAVSVHAGNAPQIPGYDSIVVNTIQSAALELKAGVDGGAVATDNIQVGAVTHAELASDIDSLEQVSNGVLFVGGVAGQTLGVNAAPSGSSTAEIVFASQPGVSVDKLLLHESQTINGNSGINVDANGNLNFYSIKNRTINFVTDVTLPASKIVIDTSTGNFTAQGTVTTTDGNINAPGGGLGKLEEDGYPIFPRGVTTLFYQSSAPTGWTKYVALNDYALRIVSSGSGGSSTTEGTPHAGSVGFVTWTNSHRHYYIHTHLYPEAGAGYNLTSQTTPGLSFRIGQTGSGSGQDAVIDYANQHRHTTNFTASGNNDLASVPINSCKYADAILASKD